MNASDRLALAEAIWSLTMIGIALIRGSRLPIISRVIFAGCFAIVALGWLTWPDRWGRFLVPESIVTIYVLLMPVMPWHRGTKGANT